MNVRFLGTGTSSGVPQIGCCCEVCSSTDPKDKRLRSSVKIEIGDKVILIDCSPDFRQQMLSFPLRKIDGILLTHEHYDHVGGIDDLRPFSVFGPVNLFMEERVELALRERLPYCFGEFKYNGIPDLSIRRIDAGQNFLVENISITPIRIMHYHLPIFGFRIGNFAYLTDVKCLDETEQEKLQGVEVLVISALRKRKHISHQTLDQALEMIERIQPQTAYLTHISHEMGKHSDVEAELPSHVFLAYDGLDISV